MSSSTSSDFINSDNLNFYISYVNMVDGNGNMEDIPLDDGDTANPFVDYNYSFISEEDEGIFDC
jgi:hypothetical protein